MAISFYYSVLIKIHIIHIYHCNIPMNMYRTWLIGRNHFVWSQQL